MQSLARPPSIDQAWQFCLDLAERRRRPTVPAVLATNQLVPSQLAASQMSNPQPSACTASLLTSAMQRWQGAARALLDLYSPLLALGPTQRFTIGHLAQGIDGNIATDAGSSRRLSGEQNHIHLHRLRALVDAVIIGAATAELDNPQLTVRMVAGQNPVRLVLDPAARLPTRLRMFTDEATPSFIVCANSSLNAALSRWGASRVIAVAADSQRLDLPELYCRLQEFGWSVVLVEGGGVTVSRMIDASCLDQVQVAISPVLVGGARRGLQLNGPALIDDCPRPATRLFRMGEDLLWDLDLRASISNDQGRSDQTLQQIL